MQVETAIFALTMKKPNPLVTAAESSSCQLDVVCLNPHPTAVLECIRFAQDKKKSCGRKIIQEVVKVEIMFS